MTDPEEIIEALRRHNVPHDRIAEVLGRDRTVATKLMGGKRNIKPGEIEPLKTLVAEYERDAGDLNLVRNVRGENGLTRDYVSVEVLPTFAGLGGGGTGDAETQLTLLPRRLVEDDLRARPEDLLVIDLRGNSMVPDFLHGDQLIIDRRDIRPTQPGPFALWDGDGYVVKNVERQGKKLRIFSSNKDYSDRLADPEEITIMGRPVWYARRL